MYMYMYLACTRFFVLKILTYSDAWYSVLDPSTHEYKSSTPKMYTVIDYILLQLQMDRC